MDLHVELGMLPVLGCVVLLSATTLVAHAMPVLMAYNDSVGAFWAIFAMDSILVGEARKTDS